MGRPERNPVYGKRVEWDSWTACRELSSARLQWSENDTGIGKSIQLAQLMHEGDGGLSTTSNFSVPSSPDGFSKVQRERIARIGEQGREVF